MGRLQDEYGRLKVYRGPFDAAAELNARYTIDGGVFADPLPLQPSAEVDSDVPLFTSTPRMLVRNLAATQVSFLTPVRVPWLLLEAEWTDDLRADATTVKEQLSQGQKLALRRFDMIGCRSALYTAFEHCAVAGQCVMHLRDKDDQGPARVRLFPLRQFVFERIDQAIKRLIVEESEVTIAVKGGGDRERRERRWYTEVDFVAGKVFQERDDVVKEVDDDPRLWVPIANEPPKPGRHYSNPFVSNSIHTIIRLNNLYRAYEDLVGEAALLIIFTRPGSGISSDDRAKLERLAGPTCIELNDPNDVGIISAQGKLADAALVHSRIIEIENQLRKDFLHGVLEAKGAIKTATHVREIVSEMEAVGVQHLVYHQDHTLLPLANALVTLAGIEIEHQGVKIQPVVLTGVSALTQQEESEAILAVITSIGQIDPTFMQSIPMVKIARRLLAPYHVETEDLFGDQAETLDIIKQLLLRLKDNPEEIDAVLPMLKSIIARFGGGEEQPAGPQVASPVSAPAQAA